MSELAAAPGVGQLEALARSTDLELAGGASPSTPVAPGAPASAPPAIPLEKEIAAIFHMAGAGAGVFLPSVAQVLEDANCEKLGNALAPVVRKYGLERHLAGFAWKVELEALFVAGPIVAGVVAAVRADLAIARNAGGAEIALAAAAAQASSSSSSSSPAAGALKPLTEAELAAQQLAARAPDLGAFEIPAAAAAAAAQASSSSPAAEQLKPLTQAELDAQELAAMSEIHAELASSAERRRPRARAPRRAARRAAAVAS